MSLADIHNNNNNISDKDASSSPGSEGSTPSSTSTAATSVTSGSEGADLSKSSSAAAVKHHHKKFKKRAPRPINHASGISTTVPLTGERSKPRAHPTLEDEVLMAIFEILHKDDPEAKGMTVKSICDILTERHPAMANLSSKTSNLVSAKLNAYVKRIEKGDKSMKYALSRVWADTSPRRMVYVYRGVLASDYPEFVEAAIEKLREEEAERAAKEDPLSDGAASFLEPSPAPIRRKLVAAANGATSAASLAAMAAAGVNTSPRSSASYGRRRGGIESPFSKASPFKDPSFEIQPQFSVPYSSAPVTASLNLPIMEGEDDEFLPQPAQHHHSLPQSSRKLWAGLLANNSGSEDEDEQSLLSEATATSAPPSSLGKRSKSMSFIQSKRPRTASAAAIAPLTAAAATPRLPRKQTISDSPSAAAAVAALRASALGGFSSGVVTAGSSAEPVNAITSTILTDTSIEPSVSLKWLETVRSGFLNQDIESPEEVSLAELDVMFA